MFLARKRCKRCLRICDPNYSISDLLNKTVFEGKHNSSKICAYCVEDLAWKKGFTVKKFGNYLFMAGKTTWRY